MPYMAYVQSRQKGICHSGRCHTLADRTPNACHNAFELWPKCVSIVWTDVNTLYARQDSILRTSSCALYQASAEI